MEIFARKSPRPTVLVHRGLFVLLAHLTEAHQDRCDFRAGGVVLRIQLAVRFVQHALIYY